jgi:deoxyribodipyrimidine photo-lyase
LLEPSHFKQYPVSQKTIDFIVDLSKNIENIQIYVGEFNELITNYNLGSLYYKEHPLNDHYQGTEEPRDWMFAVKGYYPSFFAFWKKCKKEIIF